jgi:hypothetical protein
LLVLAAFVEFGRVGLKGGEEAFGDDLLLVEGAVLEALIHQVFIDGRVAAGAGRVGVVRLAVISYRKTAVTSAIRKSMERLLKQIFIKK